MPLQLLHDHDHHINVYIYMIKLVNVSDKNGSNYYTGGCNGSDYTWLLSKLSMFRIFNVA
jgi:hypothetical protein